MEPNVLAWDYPEDLAPLVTSFIIQRKAAPLDSVEPFTLLTTVPGTARTYTDMVEEGITYIYRVAASGPDSTSEFTDPVTRVRTPLPPVTFTVSRQARGARGRIGRR